MSNDKWAAGRRVILTQDDETFNGQVGTINGPAADNHFVIVVLDTPVWTGRIEHNQKIYSQTWAVRKRFLKFVYTCAGCGGAGGWRDIEIDGYGGDFIKCVDCEGYGHTGGKLVAAIAAAHEAAEENRAQARSEAYLYGPR